MRRSRIEQALLDGEVLGGHFGIAGEDWDVPGMLRWSEDGAALELLEAHARWPAKIRGRHYTVHGLVESRRVTLLDCWTQRVANGDEVRRVRANTMAFEEWLDGTERWSRVRYATAYLSEWRADNGLHYAHHQRDGPNAGQGTGHPGDLQITAGFPERHEFDLAEANVSLEGALDTSVSHSARWSAETWQELAVSPHEPQTANELHRRFAEPLLAFTCFAADRADTLSRELLLDLERGLRIPVWRAGPVVTPREWERDQKFLFTVDHIDDIAATFGRWWKVHQTVWPALGVFAESLSTHLVYTPARLIAVFSALERYGDQAVGTTDLRQLRRYGRLPSEVTGATNGALRLLEAARGYWAHLEEPTRQAEQRQPLTRELFDQHLVSSTRVASALLQACLLRDLGFDEGAAEERMRAHYRSWPLTGDST